MHIKAVYTLFFAVCVVQMRVRGHGRLYETLTGYSMSNPIDSLYVSKMAAESHCVMMCEQRDCMTAGYNMQSGECHLFDKSIDDKSAEITANANWKLLYHVSSDHWDVLLRVRRGTNISPSQLWSTGSSTGSECKLQGTIRCTEPYRSDNIDKWDKLKVQKVRVELYSMHQERRVFITFNGTGSSSTDWFQQNKVLNSTWDGFHYTGDIDNFQIKNNEAPTISFYMGSFGAYCSFQGWLLVVEGDDANNCFQESFTSYPVFLYSKQPAGVFLGYISDDNVGMADTLIISVQRDMT